MLRYSRRYYSMLNRLDTMYAYNLKPQISMSRHDMWRQFASSNFAATL